MRLKEFMQTDTYQLADVIIFIKNGMEVDVESDENYYINTEVLSYHVNGGFLEIELEDNS